MLVEVAAALRSEVEARIEGEHDRLHQIAQIAIEAILAVAVPETASRRSA